MITVSLPADTPLGLIGGVQENEQGFPEPGRAISPGTVLRRELNSRGWTQKYLAQLIDRPEQAISEIVNGKKQLTPRTAIQLGRALNTSAWLWCELEAAYRLFLEEVKDAAEAE